MTIMNMQNEPYTIQFFSPPDDRFTVSPQAVITEHQTRKFCQFIKTPEKDQMPREVQTPR